MKIMKMKILSLILLFVSVFTKAQTQVPNCFKEDFNLPTTNGWKYSQGASEGSFDNPSNRCIEDRGIITPGVGGNNPANITTPLITSVNPKTIEVSFDIFVLDANLKCQTWKDYPCLTSVDIYYHVGTNTYIGIKDLVMPNNGPVNSSKVNIIFNSNIPSGTQIS